jgi:hypothetical protein
MTPNSPSNWTAVAPETYEAAVNQRLAHRFNRSVSELFAESVVRAAQKAGYTPCEAVDWLARVDGL